MTIQQAINRNLFPEIDIYIQQYGGGSIEINPRAITGIQSTGDCIGGNRVRPGGCTPKTFTVTINPQLLTGITPTDFIEYIYNGYYITKVAPLDIGLDKYFISYTYTYHKGRSDEDVLTYHDPMLYRLYDVKVESTERVILELRDRFAENGYNKPFWTSYVQSQYESQFSTRNLRTLFEFCVTYKNSNASVSGLSYIPQTAILQYPDEGSTRQQILRWIAETCACIVVMDPDTENTVRAVKMTFQYSPFVASINAEHCLDYTIPGYEVMDTNLSNYLIDVNGNPFIDASNKGTIRSNIQTVFSGTYRNTYRPAVITAKFDPRINPACGAWLSKFTCWDKDGSNFILTDTPSNAYVYITNYTWGGGLFMELTAAPLYETS